MGDVDKPFGSQKLSTSCSPSRSSAGKSSSSFSSQIVSDGILSEELRSALSRLQTFGRIARKDAGGLARRLYWHYFRKELEELNRDQDSA